MNVSRFLIVVIVSTLLSCGEEDPISASNQCFEVSYVTGICSQAILKIEDPDFFDLGETSNGEQNVFYTVFDCTVDESGLSQSNFFVRIKQDTSDMNCIRCLAAVGYDGSKRYLVDVVDDCSVKSSD